MSIEVVGRSSGYLRTYLHPLAVSTYDADITTETVTRFNTTDNILVNDIVAVQTNTITGETWIKNSTLNAARRYGHAVVASPPGNTAVQIKRHPRVVIPIQLRTVTESYETRTAIYFDFPQLGTSPIALKAKGFVGKLSAESWAYLTPVYGYNIAGAQAFTSLSATALLGDSYWIEGYGMSSYGVGTTSAEIGTPTISFTSNSNVYQSVYGDNVNKFQSSIFGTAPILFGSVFRSADGAQVSNVRSTTTPINYGTLVKIDKTTSPFTWSAATGINNLNKAKLDENWARFALRSVSFCQAWPLPRASVSYFSNGLSFDQNFAELLNNNKSASTPYEQDVLLAPILLVDGIPNDMAMDIDLAAPCDGLRVIWTPVDYGSNITRLVPSPCRRASTSTPPSTGMTAANNIRPPWTLSYLQSANDKLYYTDGVSVGNFGVGRTFLYGLYVGTHKNVPYNGSSFIQNTTASVGFKCRGADVPSSVTCRWTATGSVEWRWASFDYITNTWIGITSWSAASFAAGVYSATITPPTLTAEECYRLIIQTQVGGGGAINAINGGATLLGWMDPAWGPSGYKTHPYDVMPVHFPVDSMGAWVGNTGWQWPNEPSIPAQDWGIAPAVIWSVGALSMPARTAFPSCAPTGKVGSATIGFSFDKLKVSAAPDFSVNVNSGGLLSWMQGGSAATVLLSSATSLSLPKPTVPSLTALVTIYVAAPLPSVYGNPIGTGSLYAVKAWDSTITL